MPEPELIELNFPLDQDEDGWPPFATEGLWCRPEGAAFRVLTCPLFVKGVAVEDLIEASTEGDADLPTLREVSSFKVVQPSDHSTIWMYAGDDVLREMLLARLHELGCSTVSGPAAVSGHVAIDVPGRVGLFEVDALLKPHDAAGRIAVAFPALRHPE